MADTTKEKSILSPLIAEQSCRLLCLPGSELMQKAAVRILGGVHQSSKWAAGSLQEKLFLQILLLRSVCSVHYCSWCFKRHCRWPNKENTVFFTWHFWALRNLLVRDLGSIKAVILTVPPATYDFKAGFLFSLLFHFIFLDSVLKLHTKNVVYASSARSAR